MKLISLNDKQRETLLVDFASYINNLKTNATSVDYKIKIESALTKDAIKPLVFFTKIATDKMKALVNGSSKELAWHGVVTKQENLYVVEDILVYPQIVTHVTVNTDEEEYAKWLNAVDDITFSKLRLQGHSHVNMGVSPSAVDTGYYNALLNNLGGDDYYIFLILNKNNSMFLNLYDFAQNVIFEMADITIQFEETEKYRTWYEESMKLIKEPTTIRSLSEVTKDKDKIKDKVKDKDKTKSSSRINNLYDDDDEEWVRDWRNRYGYQ